MPSYLPSFEEGPNPLLRLLHRLAPSSHNYHDSRAVEESDAFVRLLQLLPDPPPLRDIDALLAAYTHASRWPSPGDGLRHDGPWPEHPWPQSPEGPWPPWDERSWKDSKWVHREAPAAWLVAHGANPFAPFDDEWAHREGSALDLFDVALHQKWSGVVVQALQHPSCPPMAALEGRRSHWSDEAGRHKLPWLHALAAAGRVQEVAAWLARPDADANQCDGNLRTALHYAANAATVGALLAGGASAKLRDRAKRTPSETWIRLAQSNGYVGQKASMDEVAEMNARLAVFDPSSADPVLLDFAAVLDELTEARPELPAAVLPPTLAGQTVRRAVPGHGYRSWGPLAYLAVELSMWRGAVITRLTTRQRYLGGTAEEHIHKSLALFAATHPAAAEHETVPGLPDRALVAAFVASTPNLVDDTAAVLSSLAVDWTNVHRGLLVLLRQTTGMAREVVAHAAAGRVSSALTVSGTAVRARRVLEEAAELFESPAVVARTALAQKWPNSLLPEALSVLAEDANLSTRILVGLSAVLTRQKSNEDKDKRKKALDIMRNLANAGVHPSATHPGFETLRQRSSEEPALSALWSSILLECSLPAAAPTPTSLLPRRHRM